MDKEAIAKRYASAIYDIAESSDKIGEIREALNILAENYNEDEEFKVFLLDPSIKYDEKVKYLHKSFDFISEDAFKIINYLVKKGRVSLAEKIKDSYLKIYYEKNNKILVNATFTKELSDNQREALMKKLEEKYKKKIVLNLSVDEELIGGGIIKIGNKVIDGSIKSQIENIKKIF
ncbi:ATP synthase F1 subunit delta [Leptotrichia sp. oral taxon 212]|jgi:ATP synthase F1, delta subunit|uniref:ATP synthase F1 subunit delta n=1 Tax=Leptotrichia sp. oral taxon 212 TaxID=712357 RepID=UPI0006A9F809|nr:ATP synthase F1 subunit delta [Leptotrichia sp. oral taxon 212]ALA95837.1 ATP synthase subunit delta [Leptotrichia sp. oral taxon 212]